MHPLGKQIIFLLFWITVFHFVIYLIGRNLPYSIYHVSDEDKREKMFHVLRRTSLESLADIMAWKSKSNINKKLFNRSGSKNLCIGVWAKNSGHDRLLSQTMGALLSRTPLIYEDRIKITVFSIEDFPELRDIKNLVNVQILTRPSKLRNSPAMEEVEYSEILKSLYKDKCSYGVILKQGVIASKEWIEKVEEFIGTDVYKNPDPEWILLRLFANYSDLSYTWREPEIILLILSTSCLLCIIFWMVTWLALKITKGDFTFLWEIHPLISVIMIISCFVGLILLGRPNMPPIWKSPITPSDTFTYPYAVLYPNQRLADLSIELDRRNVTSSLLNNLSSTQSGMTSVYEKLRRRLEKERAQKYIIASTRPSLFQNIDTTMASNIMDIPISFDFPDQNLPVTFDAIDFTAANKHIYYPN